MLTLNELRKNNDLINNIDWNMSPEKAVDIPFEEKGGPMRGNSFINGNNGSLYFVIFDGEARPQATLIRRDMKKFIELAKVPIPRDLFQKACEESTNKPGGTVHPINDTLKQWISTILGKAPGMLQ